MKIIHNPEQTQKPKTYHHGIEVVGNRRTLYIAGQIGMAEDGSIPDGIEAQTRAVFANLTNILKEANMQISDLVKSTVYLINPEDRVVFNAIREELSLGNKNASTLVFVSALALPLLLVEIDGIAVSDM
ncbi:2-iminobutanoate/2-iminopropanoate deaminase [Mucilaginibacter sp. UYP25]|uniref:RidA family protein n=1 Tax=unclassified Mucilaginibacter TaxID=2617802 RepID=UPI0033972363